ncbi:MAG: hypothetical protein U9N73_12410 [Candidatus Auribacterota bacterium]|nr:hypothetical protein [Candidatus Auribacterota bacterium]
MKNICIIIAIVLFGFTGSLSPAGVIDDIEMEAGLEVGDFHYRESHLMREDGVQGGIYGSIAILAVNPWYFQFYMSMVGGDVEYDGGYGSGWSYTTLKGDTSNYIYNFRGIVGYNIEGGSLCLMPYSGFGYRYLENDLRDITIPGVVNGYLREQTYFYLPLGVDISIGTSADQGWTVGFKSEFDWMFYGYNESGGIKLDNQDGWGIRFTPYIRYDINDKIGMKLEIFGEYWKINDSDVNEGFMEPENASNYYGGKFGILF